MANSVKKSLKDYGDKLDATEKSNIEAAIKTVEEACKGDDKAKIDEANTALMTVSQKLGEKMYADQQAAAGDAGAQAAGNSRPADDDVVDAEVKEVKKG